MAGRTIKTPPKLSALVCALFEDQGRYFFLEKTDERGRVQIELPSLLVNECEDPVSSLAAYIRNSLGLDAQIHLILLRGSFNVGTRKRRHIIPVLAFRCTVKKMSVKLPATYSGSRWLSAEASFAEKMGRNTEWLMRAEKI